MDNEIDFPPLTLSELEDALSDLESNVAMIIEDQYTHEYLINNLIITLHETNVINGHSFIAKLKEGITHIDERIVHQSNCNAIVHRLNELRDLLIAYKPNSSQQH